VSHAIQSVRCSDCGVEFGGFVPALELVRFGPSGVLPLPAGLEPLAMHGTDDAGVYHAPGEVEAVPCLTLTTEDGHRLIVRLGYENLGILVEQGVVLGAEAPGFTPHRPRRGPSPAGGTP
jgi:hypothetical protein